MGGHWRNCLRSTETGNLLWHGGEFREVVKHKQLVFTFAWEETGERGMETLVTVTFVEAQDQTTMACSDVAMPCWQHTIHNPSFTT